MEQLMWIGIGIVGGVGLVILIPVLVVGGWFIVVTLIMGFVDKTVGIVDQGWQTIRRRIQTQEKLALRARQKRAMQSKELASASGAQRGS
jgi:hypothetical protein